MQLTQQEIALIKRIIGGQHEVYLFGSRAKDQGQTFSDVDLCFKSDIDEPTLATLKVAFEESNLPYMVDLSRYNDLPPTLKLKVDEEGIRI